MKIQRDYEKLALDYVMLKENKTALSKKSGIPLSTIKRICREPQFCEALNEVRKEIFEKSLRRAQVIFSDAIETLHAMIKDPNVKGIARVQAASRLADIAFTSFDITEIKKIVEELQERQESEYRRLDRTS